MNEEEEKVEQSLMINPVSFPEEKFTKDGKGYYYTRAVSYTHLTLPTKA